MKKLGARLWFSIILIGLMGQFAWTIENMYFNVFLYNTISQEPSYIASMVAASAVCATLTTMLMGVVSDRIGKRKAFICGGYILWGLSTAAFGLITVENAAKLFPAANAMAAAAIMTIAMDCVMTFFGSTANDAAFNAYVTDAVDDAHRGRVESVLAILPLISMLIIFGGFDSMAQSGQWRKFFFIFGAAVTLAGIASIFLMKESNIVPQKKPFLSQLVYGFKPSVIRANKQLYVSLVCMCVFSIAVQIYFPYLIIYLQHFLKLESYTIVLGVALIVSSAVSVLCGKLIDRIGSMRFTIPSNAIMLAGLIAMFFARSMVWVTVAGTVMMSGYMLSTAAIGSYVRKLTPADSAGHFQGIRMIFFVMLPMIIGPFIGAAVIRGNAQTYMELGETKIVPTPAIFLAAAAVLLLTAIPVYLLIRGERHADDKME